MITPLIALNLKRKLFRWLCIITPLHAISEKAENITEKKSPLKKGGILIISNGNRLWAKESKKTL